MRLRVSGKGNKLRLLPLAPETVQLLDDLDLLKSSTQRQSNGPSRVDTVMIMGADHMYLGEEAQVAQTIAKWADGLEVA